MKALKEMSVGELAAFISSHLRKHNIEVVLTGGSCVTIYSENAYVSLDLDFVDNKFTKRRKFKEALQEIGFEEKNRYFWHPDTPLFVEFPAGPLAVGHEPVKEVVSLRFSTGELKMLSATDCVKDRLAAFYHWGDRQSLDQAELVAKREPIDLDEIERWSRREGKLQDFNKIRRKLISGKLSGRKQSD